MLGMIRWLIVSGITCVLVGLVGVLFGKGMTFVNGCRAAHPWIIWLLPVGGVAIIGLYHLFHVYNPGERTWCWKPSMPRKRYPSIWRR